MWLILCGATVCCAYLRLSYFNLLILWDLPCILGVFLSLYFLLILLDYVFVVDFVYVHSSPWWYWCGLSAVVLSELNTYLKNGFVEASRTKNYRINKF
jgi:hypothetical protein